MKNKEIERKWIVSKFPALVEPNKHWATEQIYVYVSDEIEIRVRKKTDERKIDPTSYRLTIKMGEGLVRDEVESELTAKEYKNYTSLNIRTPIHKDFKLYDIRGVEFHISKVDDEWFYAEVEFKTEEEANAFNIHDFADVLEVGEWKEVTGDSTYAMKNYWRDTRFK